VPAASPLAQAETLPLVALAGRALLGIQRCAHEDLVEAELVAAGVDPAAVERYEDNRLIQSLAAGGHGIAVVPSLTVDRADEEVRVLELEPALPPRRVALARLRERELSPAAAELRRIAVALCREVLATAEPLVR
jgi:DNA-binding transcriptional LysR family regulator